MTLHVLESVSGTYFLPGELIKSIKTGFLGLARQYDITAALALTIVVEIMKNSNLMMQNVSTQIYTTMLIFSMILFSIKRT